MISLDDVVLRVVNQIIVLCTVLGWVWITPAATQNRIPEKVMLIDSVWAGHPVGFSLLTHGDNQFIAYYNAERRMVLGQRSLDDMKFDLHVLPATDRKTAGGTSTVLGWDSHNYVTLAIDKEGYIHLAGNMHVHPLTYFRSALPYDISRMIQIFSMVGTEEDRCTYPRFMKTREGKLIFQYRDGGSGDGNEIYNIYSAEDRSWRRLLEEPLTDGLGQMNAYQSQPTLMEDDYYHVYWVWRDTPDCETNHDLSYIKSPDLIHWYNAFDEPVSLSVTPENTAVVVDPIPVNGGIINLAARLCLDDDLNPVFVYHKYDEQGNLQFYIATREGRGWQYKQITDWDYRWEFKGRGSVVSEVRIRGFEKTDSGYEIPFYHIKYGEKTLVLDRDFNVVDEVDRTETVQTAIALEDDFRGLEVRIQTEKVDGPGQPKYFLKWETLPNNRDRPRPQPWPSASNLYLYRYSTE